MTQQTDAGISKNLQGQRIGALKVISKSPDVLELRRSPLKALLFYALAAVFLILWVWWGVMVLRGYARWSTKLIEFPFLAAIFAWFLGFTASGESFVFDARRKVVERFKPLFSKPDHSWPVSEFAAVHVVLDRHTSKPEDFFWAGLNDKEKDMRVTLPNVPASDARQRETLVAFCKSLSKLLGLPISFENADEVDAGILETTKRQLLG